MAAAGDPVRVPVAVTCRVLGLSRQGYDQWVQEPVCQRDWDDAHAIDAVLGIHEDDPTLGYRVLADELADVGIVASDNLVRRLCSTAGVSPPTTDAAITSPSEATPPHIARLLRQR